MRYPLSVLPLFALVLGCGVGTEPLVCGEGELLDGEQCVPEACGTGTWGDLDTDGDTLYVDAASDPGGDGSKAHPFTRIQDGLDAQQERAMVAVAAGTYVENLQMTSDHSGVHLAGRCRELVTVDASQGSEESWEQGCGVYLEKTVLVSGWTVSDLTVIGAPWVGIYQHEGELTLDRIDAVGCGRRGIAVEYGSLEASDCRVRDNLEIGMYLSSGSFVLERMEILDTQPDGDGDLGHGLHLRNSSVELVDSLLEGNHDVGVLLESTDGVLQGVEILDTRSGQDEFGAGLVAQDQSFLV
ncbi:MAG: right-handed parallel beta-helix repeat-containing protein, partial [Myxococcota bacterium]|nr:right-handed parallel beta-helix repeat-containing protein [Myxococcota bacterium]